MEDLELKQFDESISARMIGKTFERILFFNTDSAYVDFDPDPVWIVNAGAELSLGSDFFTYGWNRGQELFDFQLGDKTDWFDEMEAEELDAMEIEELKSLSGQAITDVQIRWSWYHPLDEDLQPTDERRFIPEEVTFFFEGDRKIRLAGVEYRIAQGKLHSMTYNPMSNLLIAVDREIEIQDVPDEEVTHFEEEY